MKELAGKRSERTRCPWPPRDDPTMVRYHDREWGVPVKRDRKIFEFLVLEAFQAGLSWSTILHKRKAFRDAFAGFDPKRVAMFTARDEARLLRNAGIVRNRAKIRAAIENARHFLSVQHEYGTFSRYMWSWVNGRPIQHRVRRSSDYVPFTGEALAWAKDLRARGFRFLGPTVIYAHMQAVGMVNDHLVSCFRHAELAGRASMQESGFEPENH